MAKPQLEKKQKYRTSPRRILLAIVALIVAFLLLASVIGLAEKYIAIRKRVHDLKKEQNELLQKKALLEETNRYIQTPEGQERELRAKYNVIKPGEGVVVVTESKTSPDDYAPTTRIGKWWDSLVKGLGFRKE